MHETLHHSDDILDAIDAIAADSSKLAKQSMVGQFSAVPGDFLRVVRAALDPFVTYGIASPPERKGGETGGSFDSRTWSLLDAMAARALTGNAARTQLAAELERLSPKSAELLRRIVVKDLRAGFSPSTVNKAVPGAIAVFETMAAATFKDGARKIDYPAWCQPKSDGLRAVAFVDDALRDAAGVEILARSGQEWDCFEHIKAPLAAMVAAWQAADGEPGAWAIDGEMESGSFKKTVSEARRKGVQVTDARFRVFDMVPASCFRRHDKKGRREDGTYDERRARLEALMSHNASGGSILLMPNEKVATEDEALAFYERMRKAGFEGAMVKRRSGLYHLRRNADWTKIKPEESHDLRVVEAIEGEGRLVGMLGALIVDFKGKRVNAGTGLTDEQRRYLWAEHLAGRLVGRLVEIAAMEVTEGGSLRHPVFVCFRDDKDTEQTVPLAA